jgi:simple sugar transport system ATP-binding protein
VQHGGCMTAQDTVKVGLPAIEIIGIYKHYGHVQALSNAGLTIASGEIVAILGDNGAGKSTLLKTMCGVVIPDRGVLRFMGSEVRLTSIRDAQRLGIDVVFQDLSLAPDLSVAENLFLGHELLSRHGLLRAVGALRRSEMREEARSALSRLEIDLPSVTVPVRSLSGGQQQAVAVARAAMWARTAVLFDEPTASLGQKQSDTVLSLMKRLASQGMAVVVISHDLPRMLAVASRIVVLFHGAVVWETLPHEATIQSIVQHMMGGGADVPLVV